MKIPILSGIYADTSPEWRTSYPYNLVPVPKETGINEGFLGPTDGLAVFGTGPGVGRGRINWNGVCYAVMGAKLVKVAADGTHTTLGELGATTDQVTMDYSFDRLAIASGGKLWYWNGTTLSQVTDPDLGKVIHFTFIGGYFLTTDGTSIVVTELTDPTAVNPLKYGTSESDPDPIMAVFKLRNEVCVPNRYTCEFFQNVGGSNFPFLRVDGALVPRGAIGTHACCLYAETVAFVGSGRKEAPAVYAINNGSTTKLSTREIDMILQGYTEAVLSQVILESRTDKGHLRLYMHLPDVTWVYDAAATQAMERPVWYSVGSGINPAQYRARNMIWCYDKWLCSDPQSSNTGYLTTSVRTHYGQTVGWTFGTLVMYNAGKAAVLHSIDLVALSGVASLGVNPTIWHSYSIDGVTWSQERPVSAGKQGDRGKQLQWRRVGKLRNWRIERFRGTSDSAMSIARLEAEVEPCV